MKKIKLLVTFAIVLSCVKLFAQRRHVVSVFEINSNHNTDKSLKLTLTNIVTAVKYEIIVDRYARYWVDLPIALAQYRVNCENCLYDEYINIVDQFVIVSSTGSNNIRIRIKDNQLYVNKIEEINKKQAQTIQSQKISITKLNNTIQNKDNEIHTKESTIVAQKDSIKNYKEELDSTQALVDTCIVQKDSLKNVVSIERKKGIGLVKIIEEQREKILYSYMRLIDCKCLEYTKKRGMRNIKLGFNVALFDDFNRQDTVFLIGRKEIIAYSLNAKFKDKSEILIETQTPFTLNGSELTIPFKSERLRPLRGDYEVIFKNVKNIEIGRMKLSRLKETCQPSYINIPMFKNLKLVNEPQNKVTVTSSTVNIKIDDKGGQPDGDKVSIYLCNSSAKQCQLQVENYEIGKGEEIKLQLENQDNYLIFEHTDVGKARENSSVVSIFDLKSKNKYGEFRLNPSKSKRAEALKISIDPLVWYKYN